MEDITLLSIAMTSAIENTTYEEMTSNSYSILNLSLKDIILLIVGIPLMVWICITNSLVVYSVLRLPNMRNHINVFISCLAMADLVVGMSIPFHIAIMVRPQLTFAYPTCLFKYVSGYFAVGASVMSCLGKYWSSLHY